MIHAGTLVDIQITILQKEERAPSVPKDTAAVPLVMKVKGTLLSDTPEGSTGKIRTATGRTLEGTVLQANPGYFHSFGEPVPELTSIGGELRRILSGEG